MFPILLHINYFEQGHTTEQACRLARALGADGIEFRRKPASFQGSDLEYLDEVSRALDKYPLTHVSFGGPGVDLMSGDAAHRRKEIDAGEIFYRKASSRFPVRVVNVFAGQLINEDKNLSLTDSRHHGSALVTDAQWEAAVDGFRRLGQMGDEINLDMAFETHGMYIHDTLASTMRLVNAIGSDHVGVLWDQANMMLFPEFPSFQEVIQTTGEKLFYVHLKNWLVPPSYFLAVSDLRNGLLNIREQLRLLSDSGYDGLICLESPRSGDRQDFAKADLAYVREVLCELREESHV